MNKILLVGGSGFVGSHILSSLSRYSIDIEAPSSNELNLNDASSIENYLHGRKYDALIYCCFQRKDDTLMSQNKHNLINLIQYTHLFDKWCHISSRAVYDIFGDYDCIIPSSLSGIESEKQISAYSELKLWEEDKIESSCNRFLICRLFDTYNTAFTKGALSTWLYKYRNGIYNTDEILSPINIDIASKQIVDAIFKEKSNRHVNICGHEIISSDNCLTAFTGIEIKTEKKSIKTGYPYEEVNMDQTWSSDFNKFLSMCDCLHDFEL